MRIPLSSLTESTLIGIIESFVLREGTDYGPGEHDLADKCAAVRQQLEAGEAEIDFDPETETVDIRTVISPGRPRGKVCPAFDASKE